MGPKEKKGNEWTGPKRGGQRVGRGGGLLVSSSCTGFNFLSGRKRAPFPYATVIKKTLNQFENCSPGARLILMWQLWSKAQVHCSLTRVCQSPRVSSGSCEVSSSEVSSSGPLPAEPHASEVCAGSQAAQQPHNFMTLTSDICN